MKIHNNSFLHKCNNYKIQKLSNHNNILNKYKHLRQKLKMYKFHKRVQYNNHKQDKVRVLYH